MAHKAMFLDGFAAGLVDSACCGPRHCCGHRGGAYAALAVVVPNPSQWPEGELSMAEGAEY